MTIQKQGNPVKSTVVDPTAPAAPEKPKGKPGPKPKVKVPENGAKAEAPAAPPPPQPFEQALPVADATLVQLGQERILNAQLQLSARQRELEGTLMTLKSRYELDGRFAMTGIDIPRGVITLAPKS